MWKQFISEYLNFTRKERNGILALLSLIVLLIILPFFFPFFIKKNKFDRTEFENEIAGLIISQEEASSKYPSKNFDRDDKFRYPSYEKNELSKQPISGALFYFDPNTLDESGWKKLGLRDKTIATIKNYVTKGGKFNKPEDIGKIWGLSKEDAVRLEPFVQIEKQEPIATVFQTNHFEKTYPERPKFGPTIIDINTADTTAYIALPGIGSKLSQRIITFREKLGGFYAVEQVGETFGLPDSVFQKIKPRLSIQNIELRKLNINSAGLEELKSHPYIRYQIANAIVQYRTQHGNFLNLSDLKKIVILTDAVFEKLQPYLTLN